MNIDYAFLWSILIFIFNFVPYIGPFISSLLPAIFAMLSKGDLMQFVYVFVILEAVQIILGNFIEPKIMGKESNLGPITIIVSLTFWRMIWGIVGILLTIPITSLLLIVASQYRSTRFLAVILSQKGDVDAYRS